MENQKINQQFQEDEIALIRHFDKQRNEWITNVYPKIGGRLRLAHEENDALSIETEIVKYDEQIAVVCAVSNTVKGSFKGIGMASVERDQKIAPAILELAETRAIARSLRFAGYGVEYCSAEEVSHLENGGSDNPPPKTDRKGDERSMRGNRNGGNGNNGSGHKQESASGNGNGGSKSSGSNGNGNGRLTSKQFRFLVQVSEQQGQTKADLDKQSVEKFGTVAQYLSKGDASAMIEHLLVQ